MFERGDGAVFDGDQLIESGDELFRRAPFGVG
jgi:hypothetical protein